MTDHANMALAKTKKCRMILQQITMSLDRQNRAYKTCQHGTAELFTSSGQGLLIFDPLDNRNPSLLINYQKVSLLEESQEVGMKWGSWQEHLVPYQHVTYWHTIYYSRETKTDKCQED